jgi:regulation of enolase protein 1 (concanavalin A-like superfamily)
MPGMTRLPWTSASWLNAPVRVREDGTTLEVTAAEGSDFWRTTSYGFQRHSGHALLVDLPVGAGIEVSFVLDYTEQYDQAGLMVLADEHTWTKAGVEVAEGAPQLGAVVTRAFSDWSLAPVPDWFGREVTLRGARLGDALLIRARARPEPWRLVRVAPLDPEARVSAGLYCCAPTRPGLAVTFTRLALGPGDDSLYGPPPD